MNGTKADSGVGTKHWLHKCRYEVTALKVVILAGGLGTRLREETEYRPKPMVEVGGRPILWHIMKLYASHGFKEFVICLGYRGDMIRDYFMNYQIRNCDFTVTLDRNEIEVHGSHSETGWKVTLVETGDKTSTGGRVKRAASYLDGQRFMVTYGDGVADVDITRLLEYHRHHGRLGTVTGVRPSSRYGELAIGDGMVRVFQEKPQLREGCINGGFFVFESAVLDLIEGDQSALEDNMLSQLAERGELAVYRHEGFWQCMDTYREMQMLNQMWEQHRAPWVTWEH